MYSKLKAPRGEIGNFSEDMGPLVEACLLNRLSSGTMRMLYDIQISTLLTFRHDGSEPELRRRFSTAVGFAKRVALERKLILASQGWREAHIMNRFGVKQTGYFLPVMDVLSKVIRDAGGVEKIIGFRKASNEHGVRTFSHPCDSNIIQYESENGQHAVGGRKKVYFSLYCDETMLSRSGAVNGTVLRLRVDNVIGANLV